MVQGRKITLIMIERICQSEPIIKNADGMPMERFNAQELRREIKTQNKTRCLNLIHVERQPLCDNPSKNATEHESLLPIQGGVMYTPGVLDT